MRPRWVLGVARSYRIRQLGLLIVGIGLVAAAWLGLRGQFAGWPLRGDERVLLFTTAARRTDDGNAWLVPVHGWVFEPETEDELRGATLAVVKRALGLDPASSTSARLAERLRWFLVDNQGGKRVMVRVAGTDQALGPTTPDGHFQGSIRVSSEMAARFARGGTLEAVATSPAGPVVGTVLMVEPTGL